MVEERRHNIDEVVQDEEVPIEIQEVVGGINLIRYRSRGKIYMCGGVRLGVIDFGCIRCVLLLLIAIVCVLVLRGRNWSCGFDVLDCLLFRVSLCAAQFAKSILISDPSSRTSSISR